MKLIVAGSRSIQDRTFVFHELNQRKEAIDEVVSGMALEWLWDKDPLAGGPDRYGFEWAKENGIPVAPFPADWSKGKAAGMKRNAEMADYADAAFVFWDGESTGSVDMVKQMKKRGKSVVVMRQGGLYF
jgi:hypothetical protein